MSRDRISGACSAAMMGDQTDIDLEATLLNSFNLQDATVVMSLKEGSAYRNGNEDTTSDLPTKTTLLSQVSKPVKSKSPATVLAFGTDDVSRQLECKTSDSSTPISDPYRGNTKSSQSTKESAHSPQQQQQREQRPMGFSIPSSASSTLGGNGDFTLRDQTGFSTDTGGSSTIHTNDFARDVDKMIASGCASDSKASHIKSERHPKELINPTLTANRSCEDPMMNADESTPFEYLQTQPNSPPSNTQSMELIRYCQVSQCRSNSEGFQPAQCTRGDENNMPTEVELAPANDDQQIQEGVPSRALRSKLDEHEAAAALTIMRGQRTAQAPKSRLDQLVLATTTNTVPIQIRHDGAKNADEHVIRFPNLFYEIPQEEIQTDTFFWDNVDEMPKAWGSGSKNNSDDGASTSEETSTATASSNGLNDANKIMMVKSERYRRASRAWHVHFRNLVDYRMRHGHCKVPQRHKRHPGLGTWVNKLRQEHRDRIKGNPRGTMLNALRYKHLKAIDFDWGFQKGRNAWEVSFRRLQAFRVQFGHANVPTKYEADPSLGRWVSSMRKEYQDYKKYLKGGGEASDYEGMMNDEMIQILEKEGFQWRCIRGTMKTMKSRATLSKMMGKSGMTFESSTKPLRNKKKQLELLADRETSSEPISTSCKGAPTTTKASSEASASGGPLAPKGRARKSSPPSPTVLHPLQPAPKSTTESSDSANQGKEGAREATDTESEIVVVEPETKDEKENVGYRRSRRSPKRRKMDFP